MAISYRVVDADKLIFEMTELHPDCHFSIRDIEFSDVVNYDGTVNCTFWYDLVSGKITDFELVESNLRTFVYELIENVEMRATTILADLDNTE
jgi:hypothetical protein